MKRCDEKKISLRRVDSFGEAWERVIEPWFERTLPNCWKHELPVAVILPTRSHASALKQHLLAHGRSHLGLRFLTPTNLRGFLLAENFPPRAAAEDLHLLLALAAGEIASRPNDSEALAAKAVARAPGALLRALERLEMSGWNFDQLALPSFAPIVRRFHDLLRECGFSFPGETDRLLWKKSAESEPQFSDLLVTGFDGAHWPHWFLLRAAVACAENATVILEEPRGELTEIDLCWIGSWEETFGEARPAAKPARTNGDALFTEDEMRGTKPNAARFDFLIGLNAAEQASAITRQAVRYLAEEKCTRLGLIFSGNGALPRLVASALGRLEIPHNDGLAHIVPGIFESAEWKAWIELQRAPRINSLLRFLNALPNPAILSPNLSRSVFEKILRESYSEVLLDDLEILRAFCATSEKENCRQVADTLGEFSFLPAAATLLEFLERTQTALAKLGWKQQSIEIANRSRDWPQRLSEKISRALFLRWLEESAASYGAERGAAGDHPYARVQLLSVPHAQNQEWSHLIFCGWNEGAWPPPAAAEFAREEEIRSFNSSVQQLNKRAARQGNQGEGHTTVRENFSLYLGPLEQRAIALRQFDALLESTSESVTLTASLVHEDAPERFWNPSECFTHLYFKLKREPLTQAELKYLQSTTALLPNESPTTPDVDQTLIAFTARRDATQPAGEYDFALRPNESYRPVPLLSVSELQEVVSAPAIVWMKRYLGVEAAEDSDNPWAATTGKWVHGWLARIGEKNGEKIFAAFPASTKIDQRIRVSADERRAVLQQLCDSLGKIVPDWWTSGWLNARYLARHLGWKIAGIENWKWMSAEMPIGDRERAVKIADNVELLLRGKIDLVLARNDAADFAGEEIWIADYKTGGDKKLNTGDLHDTLVKGKTLQLGLYALAIRELGATKVDASIIAPAIKNIAPQLSVAELAGHTDIFADLAEMQRAGVFGMKGEIRPAFGYGRAYPLATLQIDDDILEDKWQRTHRHLVLEKEEWMT